jgi:hypothetical protein
VNAEERSSSDANLKTSAPSPGHCVNSSKDWAQTTTHANTHTGLLTGVVMVPQQHLHPPPLQRQEQLSPGQDKTGMGQKDTLC